MLYVNFVILISSVAHAMFTSSTASNTEIVKHIKLCVRPHAYMCMRFGDFKECRPENIEKEYVSETFNTLKSELTEMAIYGTTCNFPHQLKI